MAHDEATKAAVMASLLTGQSLNEAARAYEVPRGTLVRWRTEARARLAAEDGDDGAGIEPDRIGGLLLEYLAQGLRAATAIARLFEEEPEWMKESKNASELAVAYGVMSDKVFRLAESLESSGVRPAPTPGNGRNRIPGHV